MITKTIYYIPITTFGWDSDHYGEGTSNAEFDTEEEAKEYQNTLKELPFENNSLRLEKAWYFGGHYYESDLSKDEVEIREYLQKYHYFDKSGGIYETDFKIYKKTTTEELI